MNKNIDVVDGMTSARGTLFPLTDRTHRPPQYQPDVNMKDELRTLVLGVMRGYGVRPKLPDLRPKK
jgi:hypothetical protein